MSNQANTELLERVADLIREPAITDAQVRVLKQLYKNNDLEGLHWVMPKIEQEIKEHKETRRLNTGGSL